MASILDELFITTKNPDQTDSWTLATRFSEIIKEAEGKYGNRVQKAEFIGFEFVSAGPHMWFTSCGRFVSIRLTKDCLVNRDQAIFQLSHECIHFLSEVKGDTANVLEEGLATVFSEEYVNNCFKSSLKSYDLKYNEAAALVRRLLSFDQDVIKKLRRKEPVISRIAKEDIIDLTGCDDILAVDLVKIF